MKIPKIFVLQSGCIYTFISLSFMDGQNIFLPISWARVARDCNECLKQLGSSEPCTQTLINNYQLRGREFPWKEPILIVQLDIACQSTAAYYKKLFLAVKQMLLLSSTN